MIKQAKKIIITIEGSKTAALSHFVDVDLELRAEKNGLRTLRGKKNCFGDCCDGLLRMTKTGFESVEP